MKVGNILLRRELNHDLEDVCAQAVGATCLLLV